MSCFGFLVFKNFRKCVTKKKCEKHCTISYTIMNHEYTLILKWLAESLYYKHIKLVN